jgi:hypothetical protein
VPEIVLATLPQEIARAEPDQEVRDLLGWSGTTEDPTATFEHLFRVLVKRG